jgi:hypothetical protein
MRAAIVNTVFAYYRPFIESLSGGECRMDISALCSSLAASSDARERGGLFAEKVSEYQSPHEVFQFLSDSALEAPVRALAFYTSVNSLSWSPNLKSVSMAQLQNGLRSELPNLVRAWGQIEGLSPEGRSNFLAKVSLVLETATLVWNDLREEGRTDRLPSGEAILELTFASGPPEEPELVFDVSAWPSASRKKLDEVLEELDFARQGKESWHFNFDPDTMERLHSGANLKAYVRGSEVAQSPLALARLAQGLAVKLSLLLRTVGMYPPDHPAIEPALTDFLERLEAQRGNEGGLVAFTLLGGRLMVNNIKINRKVRAVENLLAHFEERRVNSLAFDVGLTPVELFDFMEILNRKAGYLKERGGLGEICRKKGFSGISVDEFRYALVSRDGEMVAETVTGPIDSALEDIVFRELIDRLQKGETIRDIPAEQLGQAFQKILDESAGGTGKYRSMLADFVASLDPTILEDGILTSREIQRSIAWSALRKIIDRCLEDLEAPGEEKRLSALEKLADLVGTGAERGKINTVLQVSETVSEWMLRTTFPDGLYMSAVLLGSICERLMAMNRLTSAAGVVEHLRKLRTMVPGTPALASSVRRGLAEAHRRMDSPDAAEILAEALMSADTIPRNAAERIVAEFSFRNLAGRLMDTFLERHREHRARAYSVLKLYGMGFRTQMHARLEEILAGSANFRDQETGRLQNPDFYMMRNIVGLLGDLGHRDSGDLLEKLCDDPDDRVRRLSLSALFRVDRARAGAAAREMIGDPSRDVIKASLEVLAGMEEPDRDLIPTALRLWHTHASARPVIMSFFRKTSDDDRVLRHIRSAFSNASGYPFDNAELAEEGLVLLVHHGRTEDIQVLKDYIGKVSGGLLKKQSVSDEFIEAVRSAGSAIKEYGRQQQDAGH